MFKNDIFISYSHLDNQLVPGWKEGWVSELHQTLEERVGVLLGKEAKIWRDSEQAGNHDFTADFLEQLGATAVLVPILSPGYFNSEYCPRELKAFCEACESSGGLCLENRGRVFKVVKTQIPEPRGIQPPLDGFLGYEFYSVDRMSKRVREYRRVYGEEWGQKFFQKVDDLAQDISLLLRLLNGEDPRPETKGFVYLARTTSDLAEDRESLRRDLERSGYTVLPGAPLPTTSPEIEAAVREAVARCQLSIHMISRNHYGTIPEGTKRSIPVLQNDIAAERSDLSRLVWLGPAHPEDPVEEWQGTFIERLQTEPEPQGRMDLLESSVEDLKAEVHRALAPRPERPEPAPSRRSPKGAARAQVYLICDWKDQGEQALEALRKLLHGAGCEPILPLFEGDETEMRQDHEDNLRSCDAVLLYWGAGNEGWRRRKQSEVQKSAGLGRTGGAPPFALYVAPPPSPAKEALLTHELTLQPPPEGPTAALLAPFLAKIQGGDETP
jgi:hypothetical protein